MAQHLTSNVLKKLGEVFASDFRQSMIVGGIDHPFLLKKQSGLLNAAELTSPDEKYRSK